MYDTQIFWFKHNITHYNSNTLLVWYRKMSLNPCWTHQVRRPGADRGSRSAIRRQSALSAGPY